MTAAKASRRVIAIRDFSSCTFCSVRRLCLPHGLHDRDLPAVEEMVGQRPLYDKGEPVFHQADKFTSLYAIKSGSVKTFGVLRNGKEQITGFHFAGELLGLDAICNEVHNCNAVALEKNRCLRDTLQQHRVTDRRNSLPACMHACMQILPA